MARLNVDDHVWLVDTSIDRGGRDPKPECGVVVKVLPGDGTHQEQYMVKLSDDGVVEGPFYYVHLEKKQKR